MDNFLSTGIQYLANDYFEVTNSECPICQDAYSYDVGSDNRVVEIVACKHIYHYHCLHTWLSTLGPAKNATCPFDRRVLYPAASRPRGFYFGPAHPSYPGPPRAYVGRPSIYSQFGNTPAPLPRAVVAPANPPASTLTTGPIISLNGTETEYVAEWPVSRENNVRQRVQQSRPQAPDQRPAPDIDASLPSPVASQTTAGSPQTSKGPTPRATPAEASPSWTVTDNPAGFSGRTLRATSQRAARARRH